MKKVISLVLVGLMAFIFAGCGYSNFYKNGNKSGELTPIFALAEEFTKDLLGRSPELSTIVGEHGKDNLLDDYSYSAINEELVFRKDYLAKFSKLKPTNPADTLAKEVIISDLNLSISNLSNDNKTLAIGIFNSPMSKIIEIFSYMEYNDKRDYERFLGRLEAIPEALDSWEKTLIKLQNDGVVNSKRNNYELMQQSSNIVEEHVYEQLVSEKIKSAKIKLDSKMVTKLRKAAQGASQAHKELAISIRRDLINKAREEDGVGKTAYSFHAEEYTYKGINLQELYDSQLKEVAEIEAEMRKTAEEILPNYSSFEEVITHLNNDPEYRINSKEKLTTKIQGFTDEAFTSLNGSQFTIPKELEKLHIFINEGTHSSAPYYIPPSEDFSRAGALYIPTMGSKTEFTVWRQLVISYHEGVPGHHLQRGLQMLHGERFTRYQKAIASHASYEEGWALYSEKLMADLGYFYDPGYRFGYLQARMLRSARVLIDIGLHTGMVNPNGEKWDYWNAIDFLTQKALLEKQYAANEVNRYLSDPGQAISYKVGELTWIELRNTYFSQLGDKADVKAFHAAGLSLGSVPLAVFKKEMNEWIDSQELLYKQGRT